MRNIPPAHLILLTFLSIFAVCFPLSGQEPGPANSVPAAPTGNSPKAPFLDFPLVLVKPEDVPAEDFVYDRSSRVLILGYHRFATKPADSLSTTADDLRRQLQEVRAAGFEYITMADFLAWRRGERNIRGIL